MAAGQTAANADVMPSSEASNSPSGKAGQQPENTHQAKPRQQLADVQALPTTHSIFSKWEKRFIVVVASAAGFFSPISANIYFPSLEVLADEYRVSTTLINLTVTVYMIFQGRQ